MSRQSVLLVDSNAETAEMYALGLDFEGFRPAVAHDADEAREHLRHDPPDAMVVDADLAIGDEWHLIRELKVEPCTRSVSVIVVSAWTDRTLAARADEAGCAAFLIKPCLPATLAALLRSLLAGPVRAATLRPPTGPPFRRRASAG